MLDRLELLRARIPGKGLKLSSGEGVPGPLAGVWVPLSAVAMELVLARSSPRSKGEVENGDSGW